MKQYRQHLIPQQTIIREALSVLNGMADSRMTLFVVDPENKLLGTVTDGDIRRALINGASLNDPVETAMNESFRFIRKNDFTLGQFQDYKRDHITLIPVLDQDGRVVGLRDLDKLESMLPVDAVIMAGGEGQRLRPLTEHTPKPMLKVGEKPIIEHNIDRLLKFGITSITISLRYLGEKISEYFGDGSLKEAEIRYVYEMDKLGTLGALGLMENFNHDAVLVMNSDLLTNIDYEGFYQSFLDNNADMLVAAVPYHVSVPYAVLETTDNRVQRFVEKPTYTYHSNAGIYLIKRELLQRIDGKRKYDATDFMQALIEEDKKVMTYPLIHYWLDIGKHDDYHKAQADIKHIQL